MSLGVPGYTLLVAIASLLWLGWSHRQEAAYTPKEGLGYGLGIMGGVLMLSMLIYPLRKRLRLMRNWGHMKYWLGSHIAMGVVAPIAILFHCNFALGAVNSNVALYSMLLVVASGVIGRYLYQQVHSKITGSALSLMDLRRQLGTLRQDMVRDENIDWKVVVRLQRLEKIYLTPNPARWRRLGDLLLLGCHLRMARRMARRQIWMDLQDHGSHSGLDPLWMKAQFRFEDSLVRKYLDAIRIVAEYQAYLKLFALWHMLHIPFMVLLVVTSLVHVVAVHLY